MDTITFKLSLETSSWYITRIYASLVYTSRLDMWLYLIDWRNIVDGPWMLIEDFNYIIRVNKKKVILIILGQLLC